MTLRLHLDIFREGGSLNDHRWLVTAGTQTPQRHLRRDRLHSVLSRQPCDSG
ncbi:hypothetical protein LMG31506_04500 [Cupriavidus yeoncheonensis]|uniref:Uncharacterized protein n=1 Tax=Cupriavidus yeoncheonensis TaxID=1462994 RepID=A0A916IW80_9BURK|nr:hypothetical protein LMG31506_04500 [Cupriavidus yeoncheonensis]